MIDTDVFIWYFRGVAKARDLIDSLPEKQTSAVVYMELVQSVRDTQELGILKRFFAKNQIEVINLDHEITSRAIYLLERFHLSHGLQLADALIAATTDLRAATLISGNDKHYRMIPGLSLKRFRP